MNNWQKGGLAAAVIGVILVIVFWDDIVTGWNKLFGSTTPTPTPPALKEGDRCMLNGQEGTFTNGTCVINATAQRTAPIIVNDAPKPVSGLESIVNGNSETIQSNRYTSGNQFLRNVSRGVINNNPSNPVGKEPCQAGGLTFSDGQCSTGYLCNDGNWVKTSYCN